MKKELRYKLKSEQKEFERHQKYIELFIAISQSRLNPELDSVHTIAWWRSEIDKLARKKESENMYTSKSSQRLTNYIGASFAETSFYYENKGDYPFALELNNLWRYVVPNSAYAAFNRAKIYALDKQDQNAIEALYQTKKLGMKKQSSLLNESAFIYLSNNKAYKQLLEQLED